MKSLQVYLLIILLSAGNVIAQQKVSVYFDFDKDLITSEQNLKLESLKQLINVGKAELVKMEAFTDTVGSNEYNNHLARRRANFVLMELGINQASIETKVIGENYGIKQDYSNQTHRRVDIWYQEIAVETLKLEESAIQSELLTKFTEFLNDSLLDETIIELSIHFVPGKAILLPESNDELWNLFDFFNYNQNINGFIRGHVCCSDDMPLSVERAAVVYNFLIDRSISPNRMKYQGYSNSIPAVSPEVTDEDRRRNRRVDVIFTKTK